MPGSPLRQRHAAVDRCYHAPRGNRRPAGVAGHARRGRAGRHAAPIPAGAARDRGGRVGV